MLVLPVIDLQHGIAVHGRAGQRASYQPVRSVLSSLPDPLALARGIVARFDLRQIYLADLDAIAGGPPSWLIYDRLVNLGLRLWLDAGVSDPDRYASLRDRLSDRVDLVLGLETLVDVATVTAALSIGGPERTIVSLDLDEGRPRTRISAWQHEDSLSVARRLLDLGVRRLILLDIRRVGTGQGTGTGDLLRALRAHDPDLQITCGGGIQDVQDVRHLAADGCDAVLMATALHDGRFGRPQIEWMRGLGR